MPYKRVFNKKNLKSKKYQKRGRLQVYGGAAKQLVRDVIKLKRLVNTEEKVYEQASYYVVCNNSGLLYQLCTPAVGTSVVQRIGDSIKVQHSSCKFSVLVGGKSALLRVIIFEDKQAKISTPGDYLEPAQVGSQLAVMSPKTYDNRFETKALFDKIISVDASNPIKHFEIEVPMGHHTTFDAGTATPVTGAYKMLIISDQITADAPEVSFFCRTFYTDN